MSTRKENMKSKQTINKISETIIAPTVILGAVVHHLIKYNKHQTETPTSVKTSAPNP